MTHIDYGAGHELNFLVWLCCSSGRSTCSTRPIAAAVAIVIFQRCLTLMRELQTTYWLEPAGSHGVWGRLPVLPFLLGAAQLVGNGDGIEPNSIHDEPLLDAKHGDYYYLAAVRFIRQVKRGPFGEHSPMLNDISALGSTGARSRRA